MLSFATFLGGAQTQSFGANADLNIRKGRVVRALATAGSLKLRLPVATGLLHGCEHAVVLNQGANAFDLCDSAGTVLKDLAVGQAAVVGLLTAGNPGTWAIVRLAIAF